MKTTHFAGVMLAGLVFFGGCSKTASTGPNGGDLVPIKGGTAYAELVSNADTGEMMVQTWDKDMKTRRAIEREPIDVGSGADRAALAPHPMDGDPAGMSSRFYGQADWARGAGARRGWIEGRGTGNRQAFEWQHGMEASRVPSGMWERMGEHRGMGMGAEHGRGPGGGR